MGRSSTTTDLYQPLRRFAPPPHQWGGAALLQICISPSGASRHLPINGEEQHYYRSVSAPPSGFARHLPINGEEQLIEKKGPGLHRTPARKRLTKRLKRSVLLLLRGLLGGLLGRLLGSLLLSHHLLPPSPKDMDPIGSLGFAGSMWWLDVVRRSPTRTSSASPVASRRTLVDKTSSTL